MLGNFRCRSYKIGIGALHLSRTCKQERIIVSLSCRSAKSSLPNIFAHTCGRVYGHMQNYQKLEGFAGFSDL